ncbi:MAG TPA: hypothetical protein PKO06_24795, partial [Candidatus Ozemobacteraceae bacterium]|nr:hypothetical protein [Candidatus Ozemobacteraceae bacterium]
GTSRERFTIGTTIQLVDEVCAVWGNRAWDYLIGALTAGAPKLFLMILLFYIDVDRRGFGSAMTLDPWLLFALILVYPLFFRPFAWELLGKTFLSGWPERSIRQRFQRRLTFGSYTLLLRRNLFPAMINVLLLGLFLVVPSTNLNLEVLYLGLILFFWVIPLNFCRLPLTLLDPLTPTSVEHASELGSAHAPTIRSSLTDFTWFIAYWYLAIAISFVFVASYFVRSTSGMHSLCGVLLADILLDPLWIGFHLTLTYLLKQQKAAA